MMTARQALRRPVDTLAHRIFHVGFFEPAPDIVAGRPAPSGPLTLARRRR